MSYTRIPTSALSDQALQGLIEEFVTRAGTDYGIEEPSFDEKTSAVTRQLDAGEVVIVFDAGTETTNIIKKSELPASDL